MSADDEPTEDPEEEGEAAGDEDEAPEEPSFEERLDAATEAVEPTADGGEEELVAALDAVEEAAGAAETEADLDELDGLLDQVAEAIEAADLPEPEDEDDEDPREALEARLEEVRGAVEEHRGPYAADAVEVAEGAKATVDEGDWTEQGESEVVESVTVFVDAVGDTLDVDLDTPDAFDGVASALGAAAAAVDEAGLDPDDDAGTVAALVEAAEALTTGLDEAQEWSDLTTREQLQAKGFYDVLGHIKDYPPEWSALKEHEKRGNVEMVLLALDKLGMEFMEEHCIEALKRMADEAAVEPMLARAERRDKPAIEVLGKIGSDAAVETLLEYVGTDSDPELQTVTLRALGEIGSTEATQAVADRLGSENPRIRSRAARSLGMIGDTRAIDPLANVLADDGEDTVRASAAWALVQIGTRRALEAAAAYAGDRSYIVQAEAEKAAAALSSAPPA